VSARARCCRGSSRGADGRRACRPRAIARLCQLVCDTEHPASAIEFLERMLRQPFGAEARAAVDSGLSYSTSEVDAARAAKHADDALALLEPLGDDTDPWVHATALYMRLRARVLLVT
jgi:hypothetical protein